MKVKAGCYIGSIHLHVSPHPCQSGGKRSFWVVRGEIKPKFIIIMIMTIISLRSFPVGTGILRFTHRDFSPPYQSQLIEGLISSRANRAIPVLPTESRWTPAYRVVGPLVFGHCRGRTFPHIPSTSHSQRIAGAGIEPGHCRRRPIITAGMHAIRWKRIGLSPSWRAWMVLGGNEKNETQI